MCTWKLLFFGPPEDVKMFTVLFKLIYIYIFNRALVGLSCNWPCNVMCTLSENVPPHVCLIFSGRLGTRPVSTPAGGIVLDGRLSTTPACQHKLVIDGKRPFWMFREPPRR